MSSQFMPHANPNPDPNPDPNPNPNPNPTHWQFMPHAAEMRSAQAAMLKSAKAPTVPKVPGRRVC